MEKRDLKPAPQPDTERECRATININFVVSQPMTDGTWSLLNADHHIYSCDVVGVHGDVQKAVKEIHKIIQAALDKSINPSNALNNKDEDEPTKAE